MEYLNLIPKEYVGVVLLVLVLCKVVHSLSPGWKRWPTAFGRVLGLVIQVLAGEQLKKDGDK